ncbi:MAG TPA: prolipoprotein diacylglyceryl transferase [Beijerinckiaceae bacterium]|nr:prolipoprotein diacylglyceryl transferase [Beijerinckiaceae bacterium]
MNPPLTAAFTFPGFDPVAIWIGPLPIRWYALAYIGGLLIGWWYARSLAAKDRLWGGTKRPAATDLDDLLVYAALGVVIGGRLGYVIFYNPGHFLANPLDTLQVWRGGMAFHGGLIGAAAAVWLFARRRGLEPLALFDLCCTVVPVGLLLGRIANFINGELWGRETSVSWGVIFPHAGPVPRHPSQLYEAALEGALLLIVLGWAARRFGFARPGLLTGLFAIGYGLARIASEFFREADEEWGYFAGDWLTMGMLLSLPMILAGAVFLRRALMRRATGRANA